MDIIKFKENFPGLKDDVEEYTIPLFPDGTIVDDGWVEINMINEKCLDKQIIKEKIEKLFSGNIVPSRISILEELGIE